MSLRPQEVQGAPRPQLRQKQSLQETRLPQSDRHHGACLVALVLGDSLATCCPGPHGAFSNGSRGACGLPTFLRPTPSLRSWPPKPSLRRASTCEPWRPVTFLLETGHTALPPEHALPGGAAARWRQGSPARPAWGSPLRGPGAWLRPPPALRTGGFFSHRTRRSGLECTFWGRGKAGSSGLLPTSLGVAVVLIAKAGPERAGPEPVLTAQLESQA